METKKTTSILPGVIYTQLKDTYTFKEITETEELEEAFRLRYEVYSKSKVSTFINQDNNKIDIDEYDLHSKHYGLYFGQDELVGYIKVVLERNKYYNNNVFVVGNKFGVFNESDHSLASMKNNSSTEFPFLNYSNLPKDVSSFYNDIKNSNEGIIEASRLILIENHRGLLTISFLIESSIAIYTLNNDGQKYAVASCRKEHGVFYQRYGFKPIGDGESFNPCKNTSNISALSFSMELSLSSVHKKFHSKFNNMVDEFLKTGKITRAI